MRQLQSVVEIIESVENRTLVLVWTEDSQIFRAELQGVWLQESYDEVLSKAVGKRIPENHLFPPWTDTLTEAKPSLAHDDDVYVKTHYASLLHYNGTPKLTELFMAEVKILELISKNPHPNVNEYLGCIRNGNLIGGICLRKCVCTLKELVDVQGNVSADQAPPFECDVLINGIKAAIDHIHSLTFDGIHLVHDDINPRNIMVDAAGNPILIDFDSCVTVGSPSCGGTPGWSKNPQLAAFENDIHGFELVTKFILREYDGEDTGAHFDEDGDTGSPK